MWLRQRTARHPFVHYMVHFSCALFRYSTGAIYIYSCCFFYVAPFSCCTFFILQHFHVALFYVVIFSCYDFFVFHSFYALHYFMMHFYTMQCFRFGFFSSCSLCMLQFIFVILCSCSTVSRGMARNSTNM